MRPSVSEQLREARRILSNLLTPEVTDEYTAHIAGMVFANLKMLETAWADVLPFLHWDNKAALRLLSEVKGEVNADLAAAIQKAEQAPPCEPLDPAAMQVRNEDLHELIFQAIRDCGAAGRRRIHALLLERTARYPMRAPAATVSRARPTKED